MLSRDFIGVWESLLNSYPGSSSFEKFTPPPIPRVMVPKIDCGFAWRSKSESIPLGEAIGRVSAEMVCPYPPGIPMVIPGEVLDHKRVEWLVEQKQLWPDQISSQLRVVCQ